MADDTVSIKIEGEASGLTAATNEGAESLDHLKTTVAEAEAQLDLFGHTGKAAIDGHAEALRGETAAAEGVAQAMASTESASVQAAEGVGKVAGAAKAAGHALHGAGGSAAFWLTGMREMLDEGAAGRMRNLSATAIRLTSALAGISPAAAGVVIATAAVVGSFAIAIGAAEGFDRALGRVQVGMDATGKGSQFSRVGIAGVINELRQMPGVSTAAAETLVNDFARQQSIGVDAYGKLGMAAAGFARVTGEEVPRAGAQLVASIDGGYESLLKLNNAYHFLTEPQLQAIQQMEREGNAAGATAVAIDALYDKFHTLVTDGMTPMQLATANFESSWSRMLQTLGETSTITQARNAITGLMDAVTEAHGGVTVDPTNLGGMKDELAKLQKQRADNQADEAKGGPGFALRGLVGMTPTKDDDANLDARIAKLQQLIAAQEKAQQATKATPENPDTVIGKGLEAIRGTATGRRDEVEKKLASTKNAAGVADSQAAAARAKGDTAGAAGYEADAQKLRTAAQDLETELASIKQRGGENQLQQMQEVLNKQLLGFKGTKEQQQQIELSFWQKQLASAKDGTGEYGQILQRVVTLQQDLNDRSASESKKSTREDWENFSEGVRQKIAAAQGNLTQQLALAQQWVDYGKQLYGNDVANYRDALNEKSRLENEQKSKAEKATLDRDRGTAENARKRMGEDAQMPRDGRRSTNPIDQSAQMAGQQAKMDQDYSTAKAGYQSAMSDTADPAQQQQILNQLDALNQEYAQKTVQLHRQATSQIRSSWDGIFQPVTRGFSQAVDGMLTHAATFGQGMRKMGQQMVLNFVNNSIQMAAHWIADRLTELAVTNATEAAKTGASAAGAATRNTVQAAASSEGKAAQATDGSASILQDAYKAAAGAYSAVAGIPYVGPVLAPVAAATAFAAVAAFNVISAAGGYDVPHDGMPAVLHKQERVLPSHIANPMRDFFSANPMGQLAGVVSGMAAAGAGGGGRGGTTHNHHWHAIDGHSVQRFLDNHGERITKTVSGHQTRNPSLRPRN